MAAIAAVATASPRPYRVRSATAQASTGQTDWIRTPSWAKYARITITMTASGGTTPILLPSVLSADPVTADDTFTSVVGGLALTGGITSTGQVVIEIGPGVTGIANATAAISGSGSSLVQLNAVVPTLLGIKVLNDRTTGDETYTYTVTAEFSNAN